MIDCDAHSSLDAGLLLGLAARVARTTTPPGSAPVAVRAVRPFRGSVLTQRRVVDHGTVFSAACPTR